MKQKNRSKIRFLLLGAICLFGAGVIVGTYKVFPYAGLKSIADDALLVIEEWPVLTGSRPLHHLQPARRPGDGVTVNLVPPGPPDLVFMSSFFDGNPGLRLIRRDGSVVARWEAAYSEIFPASEYPGPSPATDWNIDIHGAIMLPDGSVMFNFEYIGFVRLDRCGAPLWVRQWPTHHSIEPAAGGGFWVPGRRSHDAGDPTPFPPFPPPFIEDTLLRILANGEALAEISVPAILYENGLEALLTGTGQAIEPGMVWDEELVHLNKITELSPELAGRFPMFEAGDLLLSLRTLNLLLVYSPVTGKVKWHQTGPWLRQHDPEFSPDGRIVLFNNNTYIVYEAESGGRDLAAGQNRQSSNIMAVDPATGVTEVLYGDKDGQELLSVIRSKVDLTAAGGLLITEFEGGRVLETDATGAVIWEYINRYDEDTVVEVTGARLYPESYFEVTDWSCPVRPGGG